MRKLSNIALLLLGGWSLPCLAAAQTARGSVAPVEPDKVQIEQRMVQGGGRGGVVAPVETRITTGKPYSAEAVTESLQVLGDGNRISRRTVTRVYRDNDGRTRREQFQADGTPQLITISDPVAQVSYALNPQTKTGSQSAMVALRMMEAPIQAAGEFGGGAGAGAGAGGGRGRGAGGGAQSVETQAELQEKLRKLEQARTARVEQAETSRSAAEQAKQVVERAASGGGESTKENLGEQVVEGVRATGTRTTTVIPAGSSIGNLNEIRIVSEQWFSPDLDVLVLTRHSDPRVGETVYKLTNVVRAQPDPNLFVPPADYTIRGRSVRNPQ